LNKLKIFHPGIKGFGGHTTRHYLNYEQAFKSDIFYFTFLREPISRYLSHFQYQVDKMEIKWDINKFIDEPRFNNYMTNRLTKNLNDGNKAYQELKKFDFLGIVEHFDESIIMLAEKLEHYKIKPYYEIKNKAENNGKISFKSLSKIQQKKIIKNNQQDIILYNRVIKELFPLQIHNYKGNIEKDLSRFNLTMKSFKYSKLRFNYIKLLKGYNHFISEPIAHYFK